MLGTDLRVTDAEFSRLDVGRGLRTKLDIYTLPRSTALVALLDTRAVGSVPKPIADSASLRLVVN